jgi:hypothetical protein
MNSVPKSRKSASLSESLRSKVDMYGLAAAATGLGIAALTTPAQAEVVYTQAHQEVGREGVVLDLNRDGIPDFEIVQENYFADGFGVTVYSHALNRAFGAASRANFLSMLPIGYTVGSNPTRFQRGVASINYPIPHKFLFYCEAASGGGTCTGAWEKGTNSSYVGFKFLINGEVHYGWARLKVTVARANDPKATYLTGYAYETIANKPIVTGNTGGTAVSSEKESATSASLTRSSATLGMLSAGASALPFWRNPLQ